MSRRSGSPASIIPSGWSRNSTTPTATAAALATSSATRSGPTTSGAIPSIPASPRVTSRYATSWPAVGPHRDRRRGAVLEVVGVGDDGQGGRPVVGQRQQRGLHGGDPAPSTPAERPARHPVDGRTFCRGPGRATLDSPSSDHPRSPVRPTRALSSPRCAWLRSALTLSTLTVTALTHPADAAPRATTLVALGDSWGGGDGRGRRRARRPDRRRREDLPSHRRVLPGPHRPPARAPGVDQPCMRLDDRRTGHPVRHAHPRRHPGHDHRRRGRERARRTGGRLRPRGHARSGRGSLHRRRGPDRPSPRACLDSSLADIQRRAPGARLVVTTYPRLSEGLACAGGRRPDGRAPRRRGGDPPRRHPHRPRPGRERLRRRRPRGVRRPQRLRPGTLDHRVRRHRSAAHRGAEPDRPGRDRRRRRGRRATTGRRHEPRPVTPQPATPQPATSAPPLLRVAPGRLLAPLFPA